MVLKGKLVVKNFESFGQKKIQRKFYHMQTSAWLSAEKMNMKLFSHFSAFKVNSVQETCAKCFSVHLIKFEILPTT